MRGRISHATDHDMGGVPDKEAYSAAGTLMVLHADDERMELEETAQACYSTSGKPGVVGMVQDLQTS